MLYVVKLWEILIERELEFYLLYFLIEEIFFKVVDMLVMGSKYSYCWFVYSFFLSISLWMFDFLRLVFIIYILVGGNEFLV